MISRKMRDDLPPFDIRKKPVKGFLGIKKMVPTTKFEQRAIKNYLMNKYPDRYFLDDLNEFNTLPESDDSEIIDDIETLEKILKNES